MSEKPKFVQVTDPEMQEELLADPADIGRPYPFKPNGDLWVEAGEFEAWRNLREVSE